MNENQKALDWFNSMDFGFECQDHVSVIRSALSTPATTSEAPPTAQGVEGWKEKQLPRSIEEAEAQWFGGRCTGWEHDLLEAARKYASLTHPREQQRVEEWKYCPECGSKEFHGPYEGGERVCSKCSQSWFPDVDYTEVVQEHLSNRKARQSSGHVCDENCGGAINSRHCPIASSGRQ